MAMFAVAAMIATTQIMAGQAAKKEGEYNARIFEQQMGTIDIIKDIEEKRAETAKNIENKQYQRVKGQVVSTTIARTAKSGLDFGGSPVAVLVDTLTEVGIDQAIGKYNIDIGIASRVHELEMERTSAFASAAESRRKGILARNAAYGNAFSTLMMGAYSSASRMGAFKAPVKMGSETLYGGPDPSGFTRNISAGLRAGVL